jgi:RNA recognition motif-containing protein
VKKVMTKKLYVGNLADHTTTPELTGLFAQVGHVVSVRLIMDRDTGRSKRFGFVEMESEAAARAITQLHHTALHGRPLSVTEARAQSSTEGRPPPSRLFVNNLPYETTAAELKDFFSSVGPVSFLSLPVERESGKPRGFAFVEFVEPAHAQEAIRRFHSQLFNGRALAVREALAKESRPAPSFSPQSSPPRLERSPAPPLSEPPSRERRARHQFGPDAPRQSRKQTSHGSQSDRPRRKPIPERKGGQFFGPAEEEVDEG